MNEQTQKDLLELLSDLDKICETAAEGNVEVWRHDDGTKEVVPYSMTGNAFNDVCGAWQSLRTILVKNGVAVP